MRFSAIFLLTSLLLASCAKEEMEGPCGADTTTESAKGSFDKDGPVGADGPDGGTISDDGDDLNDSERSRKKKKP
jgi:hypothetical protein